MTVDLATLNEVLLRYYRTTFWTSLVVIVALIACTFKVLRGSKHCFLITLIGLLMGYNVSDFLCNTFARVWIEDPTQKYPYLQLQSVFIFLRDATFNLVHWIFSFKYWVIAFELDLIIYNEKIAGLAITAIKTLNYTVIALDILMPAVYATTFYVLNLKYEN